MDELQEAVALTLKRRPWMNAEEWSIWEVSGTYGGSHGTFTQCLAVALPHYATGGHVLFKMIGTLDDIITPEDIVVGVEYQLVRLDGADTPADRPWPVPAPSRPAPEPEEKQP